MYDSSGLKNGWVWIDYYTYEYKYLEIFFNMFMCVLDDILWFTTKCKCFK